MSYPQNDAKVMLSFNHRQTSAPTVKRVVDTLYTHVDDCARMVIATSSGITSLDVATIAKNIISRVDKKAVDRQGEMDYKSLPLSSSKTGLSME